MSSGDYSFDARNDGKHLYCFSNEAWSASTKEISFNVHGIVYVPESEAPSDPLESEGVSYISTSVSHLALEKALLTTVCEEYSQTTRRALESSQR